MPNQPPHLILNQFSPLQRQPLLGWLEGSPLGRRCVHRAFAAGRPPLPLASGGHALDSATKIAFVVAHEFGSRLSSKMTQCVIETVEQRLSERKTETPPS